MFASGNRSRKGSGAPPLSADPLKLGARSASEKHEVITSSTP